MNTLAVGNRRVYHLGSGFRHFNLRPNHQTTLGIGHHAAEGSKINLRPDGNLECAQQN